MSQTLLLHQAELAAANHADKPAADSGDGQRAAQEALIREAIAAGDMHAATNSAIGIYGPEVRRFLQVRLRSRESADDAFSRVCEDLWMGLPSFAWRSSLRTWFFVLARHAACRVHVVARRERARFVPLDEPQRQCPGVQTSTARFLKTENKRNVRQLREQLDDDQQTLLVLRVDRCLSYRELAVVMEEVHADATEEELTRASARVRTRFQAAKKRLRELALRSGLLTEGQKA